MRSRITIRDRFRSSPNLILAPILLLLCITPVIFWPPFVRSKLYSALATSKVFTRLQWPDPIYRPWGLWIWDRTHAHSVFLASVFLPLVIPLSLWYYLDLSTFWASNGVESKLTVVQLLSASIFGSVALAAFLSFQLPRILRPRVHICFLKSDIASEEGSLYLGDYVNRQSIRVGRGTWVHVRVANIGTISYSNMTVIFMLPDVLTSQTLTDVQINVSDGYVFGDTVYSRPQFVRPYLYEEHSRTVRFNPNNNPAETGPGAGSMYSFYVKASNQVPQSRLRIRVFVSGQDAVGTTVKDLNVDMAL